MKELTEEQRIVLQRLKPVFKILLAGIPIFFIIVFFDEIYFKCSTFKIPEEFELETFIVSYFATVAFLMFFAGFLLFIYNKIYPSEKKPSKTESMAIILFLFRAAIIIAYNSELRRIEIKKFLDEPHFMIADSK